jgi:hypothetical protein
MVCALSSTNWAPPIRCAARPREQKEAIDMRIFRSGRVATVAATAAAVLAIGGTSYATALITSAQIKDGTIQGVDIHAGTIGGGKIADRSIRPVDLAAAARTRAYSTYHDAAVSLSTSVATLMTLHLPVAGSYVINAKTQVRYTGSSRGWGECVLVAGADFDTSLTSVLPGPAPEAVAMLPLQVVHTFSAPGTAVLRCSGSGTDVTAAKTKITAVSVTALTNTGS